MEAQRAKAEARPSPRRNPLRPLLGRRGKTVGLPWRVATAVLTTIMELESMGLMKEASKSE